jgi:hypothetical protein
VLACVLLVASSCEQNKSVQEPVTSASDSDQQPVVAQPSESDAEPLLLLDEEPLLLLDDEETAEAAEGSGADNSRCFVCHANYLDEQIAVTHARVAIGCAHCHGDSDAHIADESWGSGGNGTAPDIMYPMDEIVPACMKCHAKDTIDIPEHEPVFGLSTEKKVCTDCHGEHRLAVRRCKWK